jgi:hypothetical protein
MLNGRPVFPGTSTMNQIERIIEVTNMPPKIDVDAVASPYAATMLESLPVMNYKVRIYICIYLYIRTDGCI